jgi:transposase
MGVIITLTYANLPWPKLIRILDTGYVELDNNQIENEIRPLALGRKNFLFAVSHAAGELIGMKYSYFGG